MTGRERLLTVLNRDIPDRVPVSFFVTEEYLSYFYPQKEKVNRLQDAVDCARHYGFDICTRENQFVRPYWLKQNYPNWEIDEKRWVENDVYNIKSTITTPSGVLEQLEVAPYDERTQSGIHTHTSEFFIKGEEDFEIFRKYFPRESAESIAQRHEAAALARKVVGETGITAPWGAGGVYNTVTTCRDMQEVMMDPLLKPDFYKEIMEFFTSWIRKDYEIMCETGYDAFGIQGNIANGGLMGEEFFMEHVYPYEKEITTAVRDAGKFTIYHNCGYARNLYPCYKALGMDVWETISPLPMGDNTLSEAKEYFGDSLILSGGLDQVEFLKTATPDQVHAKVKELVETGKEGGHYIFAASDFLEKDTPEVNVQAAVDAAVKNGSY
ncbi:MAG: uroporphyrinogen decarboxylase family protein [Spirochaetales bacterium]|nr:uroporphyrinogen decarboxylase family protein [Spirochaetales bacterium]